MCQGHVERCQIHYRVRAGWAGVSTTLPPDRSDGRHRYLFVEFSLHPAGFAQASTKPELSISLANIVCPTLRIPWDPAPPAQLLRLSLSLWLLYIVACLGSCCTLSPNLLKAQTPNKQQRTLTCLVAFFFLNPLYGISVCRCKRWTFPTCHGHMHLL